MSFPGGRRWLTYEVVVFRMAAGWTRHLPPPFRLLPPTLCVSADPTLQFGLLAAKKTLNGSSGKRPRGIPLAMGSSVGSYDKDGNPISVRSTPGQYKDNFFHLVTCVTPRFKLPRIGGRQFATHKGAETPSETIGGIEGGGGSKQQAVPNHMTEELNVFRTPPPTRKTVGARGGSLSIVPGCPLSFRSHISRPSISTMRCAFS